MVKIEYVLFDMDGASSNKYRVLSLTIVLRIGLMIDSEKIYSDVTSSPLSLLDKYIHSVHF